MRTLSKFIWLSCSQLSKMEIDEFNYNTQIVSPTCTQNEESKDAQRRATP